MAAWVWATVQPKPFHVCRAGSDHPVLDEDLSGDHGLIAARQQRRHRPDDVRVLRRLRCGEPQEDVRIEENPHR